MSDLPVRAALPRIVAALAEHGTAVLVAPPGTGKTTLVPPALPGRVVVAEPRRVAARAAAARMAALAGEPVGASVGYAVRGDRKVSRDTRIEVVTSGLLVRRLQSDPELSGVDTVLLDECHERHLDADLLLALLLDARDGLRPDLRVLATSATVAADRLSALLGDAPVVRVAGVAHPVTTTYVPPARGERLEATVSRAIHKALSEGDGDVLAFLPGAAEIRRVAAMLDVDVVVLHGRLPAGEQDAALRPGARRRVVLATAVAESSLTVPGVRAVVDAGLARVPRVDHGRGLSGLVTVRVSAAVAEQRAGRAGREAPGRVYRCWPEHEQATLPRYPEPEIRTADLTRLALELACWGTPDGAALRWWDAPPPGPLAAARATLTALGALNNGEVTDRGREMARLGLHPRLARALVDCPGAAEVVAVLDDDTLATSADLDAALRSLRRGSPATQRWRREVKRLRPRPATPADAALTTPEQQTSNPAAPADAALVTGLTSPEQPTSNPAAPADAALVTGLAFPERLARRRAPGSRSYLMAGGTAVDLPPDSGLGDPEWLAVASADWTGGAGRVRLAARADEATAVRAAPALLVEADEVRWADGDVVARRVRRLGAIVLRERPLTNPPQAAVRAAVLDGLAKHGLSLVRFSDRAASLRARLDLLHRALGWPPVDDDALLAHADTWAAKARNAADLRAIDMTEALRALLPWPEASRLDELAPERITVPSGSRIKVDYTADPPALPVKIQEVFGWTASPTVADGKVPVVLHLLSPAGRPAAVTGDLAGFWRAGYKQVRAELRGRYPRHRWPEDPTQAEPSRRTTQPRK